MRNKKANGQKSCLIPYRSPNPEGIDVSLNETEKNRIKEFFRNPVIGIAGSFASILGIILSIYFYLGSIATPELTYLIHPVKAAVFRAGQSSKIAVTFDGKVFEDDITATQIAIWNDGNRPIRETEILKPLIIKTANGNPIIEAKIRKTNREVVKASIDTSKLDNGEVKVLWNIMEKGDGCIIQLIYKGDEQVNMTASAVIEGQSEIKVQQFRWDFKSFDSRAKGKQDALLLVPILMFLVLCLCYLYFIAGKMLKMAKRLEVFFFGIYFLCPIIMCISFFLWYVLRKPLGPPFGF